MEGPLLALWCVPRSRSTVFLRTMAERGDLTVVHEPFSRVGFFGSVEVGDRQCTSESEVMRALEALGESGPVFFKETTDYRYADVLADRDFLRRLTHAVMIRPPEAVVASYLRIHPVASRAAMGFEHLTELYDAVIAATGEEPFVLDGDRLAAEPAATVAAYCRHAGIPFLEDALHWEAGAMADWGPFAHWHEKAAQSTGFVQTGTEPLPASLRPRFDEYVAHHQPFYARLVRAGGNDE